MGKGIIYKVKKGETLASIAEDFGITVYELRNFHNLWCEDIRDQVGHDIYEGKELTVAKEKPSPKEIEERKATEYQEEKRQKKEDKQKEEESQKSSQDNKYFVVHGAKCLCDKGTTPATLEVTSHRQTIFNSRDGEKWAATVEDVQFQEGASCFGSCKLKNNNPCTFSPAGKWLQPYENVRVIGKPALIETSYLMCAIGGKITVKHHGQTVMMGNSNLQKADPELMNQVLPGLDLQDMQAAEESTKTNPEDSNGEAKITGYSFTDLSGNELQEIAYSQQMFLNIQTENMAGKFVNYEIYHGTGDNRKILKQGIQKKIIKPNGNVNFIECFFMDMPMASHQDLSAAEHHYSIWIWEVGNESYNFED